MDHDGDLDIAQSGEEWIENRDGRFDRLRRRTPRHYSEAADRVLGDFDGDGFIEMALAWYDQNDVVIVTSTKHDV